MLPGDAVQQMPTQRVIDSKLGVIEIIGRVVMHANRLHDFFRRQIALRGEGHDLLQGQPIKACAQCRPGRLTGVTQAPMLAGQAPADFHRRGEGRIEAHHTEAGKTDELAAVLALQRPQAETVFGKMPAHAADHRRAFQATHRRRKIAHHLRIGAHRCKCRQILIAPLAHQQACAFEFVYRLHRAPPFPCRKSTSLVGSFTLSCVPYLQQPYENAMPLPLIYHEDYSPEFPADHRFPMDKFRLLRDHLVDSGLTRDADLLRPQICPNDILALAHDRRYIERYMSGELSREDQRRLGLPWNEALARRTVRAVGGSILAAEKALEHGLACHLAGGTHHAHYDYPAGFCIFNDLAIISHYLLQSGRVNRVLIFDCDVHQGDGTARILHDTPEAITVSLHCEKNFPARKAESDWDIPLPKGMGDADYLKVVDDTLNYLLPLYQPDLVLYDAGVDVHKDDALGYLQLTDAGVAARDESVMRHCLGRDIPVVGVIGGGYSKDRHALARRHGILHHSAQRVWTSHGCH